MASREKKLVGTKYISLKKDLDAKTLKVATGKQEGVVRKLGRPPKCKEHQSNIVRAKKRIWKHRPKLALGLGRPRKAIKKSVEPDAEVDGKSVMEGSMLGISSSNIAPLAICQLQSNNASENYIQDVPSAESKQQPTNSTDSAIQKEPAKVKRRFKKRITTIAEPSKLKKICAKVGNPATPSLDSSNSSQVSVPSLAPPKKKLGRPSLKVKRSISTNALPTVNLEVKNGTRLKVRPSPYTTRSGVPPQLLRNGKRRKFKEPMAGIEVQTPKTKRRRRLLSTTTDGSNVDSLNDPFVEEQTISRIGSESDSSFLDSYQMENGTWDSDVEMKSLEAFSKEGIADTSKHHINGEPSKSKESSTETIFGNHIEKPAESKIDALIKKNKSLRDADEENEVFDFVSTVTPNSIDNSPKTDSNSNLCDINNVTGGSNNETTHTNNLTLIAPKMCKVVTKKSILSKGEKQSVSADISSELTPCMPIEGTSKNLVGLSSDQLEQAGSPNSLSTGTDRALTPSENWETMSVTSTPSSKNFDVSFDDISEKDTDCENGKDIRRSQRSSIRKSRAALLRLATRKKGAGKTDTVGDIQLAIGGVFVSPAHDDIGLVMKDIKVEVNNELTYTTEATGKKSLKENVNNVENQGSCSVTEVIESVIEAQVGGTIKPVESKECRKPNLVKKRSLKAIERRRRVKSLNTQDIAHLVQNDLCTLKERRASDFLSISDNSTVPQSNDKSNKPRKYKLKRSSGLNTLETSKPLLGKDILDSALGSGLLETRKRSSDSSSVLQGNKKFNKARKYKLKRLTDMSPFDKVILINNPLAGGSKSENAKTCREPNKIKSFTDVGSKQSELCDSLPLGNESCSPGPAGKAFLKTKKPFPRMLAATTADEDVMVIEARLLKNAEAEDSISKVEFKEDIKLGESEASPIKSTNTLDNLRDEDMAEKLRELSKKIESESDMFPSLYVKPLIPLSLKMEPNENCTPLKIEPKIKTLDTTFKDNKSMPVLKKEKRIEDIVSEPKEGDLKLDNGPPRMEKMDIAVESTNSVLTNVLSLPSNADDSKTPKKDINLATSRPTEDTNMYTDVGGQNELPTGTPEKCNSVKKPLEVTTLLVDKCSNVQTKENITEINDCIPHKDTITTTVDEKLLPSNDIEEPLPVGEEDNVLSLELVAEEFSSTSSKEEVTNEKEEKTNDKEVTVQKSALEIGVHGNGETSALCVPNVQPSEIVPNVNEATAIDQEDATKQIALEIIDKCDNGKISAPCGLNVHSSEIVPYVNVDTQQLENSTQGSCYVLMEGLKLPELNEMELQTSDTCTLVTENIDPGKRLIEEETPENMAVKETILSALGLLSLEAAKAAKIAKSSCIPRIGPDNSYTGTLKTIIKVQRSPEKRTRPLKMILKNNKPSKRDKGYDESDMNGFQYSICKDAGPSSDDPGTSSSVGVGNHISSNPQLFVEDVVPAEPVEQQEGKEGEKKQLVIPEKASSFSIHPGRLCSDVCSYCFGKFGSLDTPCHIAQLKGSERQVNILKAELHLTADSCLCDACYRHVDRKANCPTYREKTKGKKQRLHHMSRAARPKATCCVLGCLQTAQHHVRRKWLTKLKRSIGKKVPVINNKLPPHVPLPLCSQHYAWVDHFMICGICRRRLNCNQMYPLGPEVHEINTMLSADRIPVRLVEKVFLCKLCRYFTSLRAKFIDRARLTGANKMFYESYRKKILQFLDVDITEDPEPEAPKRKRRKMKVLPNAEVNGEHKVIPPGDKKQAETMPVINLTSSEDSSPQSMDISTMLETQLVEPMIDYSTLGSDVPSVVSMTKIGRPTGNYRVEPVKPTKIRLTFGNAKPGSSGEGKKASNLVILEREPEAPSFTSVLETPQLSVTANFDFRNPIPVRSDAEGEWEKCAFSLQYDRDSKQAFEKLKRPYGSQSSFFRHLLLLEQYWRSGELMASPTSNSRTKSYLKSVQNRIDSFSMSVPPITYSAVVPKLQSVPTTSVPIIDLPLRRLSGGIMTTPRAATFTCTSAASMPSTSVTNPMFVSQMPSAKKYVMNPTTGQYVATKRKPNIVQVTKGGQPLFRLVDPTKSQIRALQGYKRKVPTATVTSDSADCVPLICDVRSLGEEGTKLWNTKPTVNVVAPVTSQPPKKKNTISILPKPPVVGPKPNTVLTPTGIILSKKLDVSVSPIMKKDDLAKS